MICILKRFRMVAMTFVLKKNISVFSKHDYRSDRNPRIKKFHGFIAENSQRKLIYFDWICRRSPRNTPVVYSSPTKRHIDIDFTCNGSKQFPTAREKFPSSLQLSVRPAKKTKTGTPNRGVVSRIGRRDKAAIPRELRRGWSRKIVKFRSVSWRRYTDANGSEFRWRDASVEAAEAEPRR